MSHRLVTFAEPAARDAVRVAYEMQFFGAFPDPAPSDEGMAFGDDTVVVWGTLHGTSLGDWPEFLRAEIHSPCPSPTWCLSVMG